MTTVRTSTTARTLRRLRIGLLALAIAVPVLSFTVFEQVHGTIDTVAHRSLPAVLAVASAAHALGEANSDAMNSLHAGTFAITGPGSDYQTEITLAGQSLEHAAEANQAGDTGTEKLLLVDSQVAEYRQLIEQAHADFARNDDLGRVYLAYASNWMHNAVLAQLTQLHNDEENAVAGQVSSVWMKPWAAVIWVGPGLGMLLLLVIAQAFLSRRFRRRLNGWLIAATALLILLVLGTATTLLSEHRLQDAMAGTNQLVYDLTIATGGDQIPATRTTAVTNAANTANDSHQVEYVIPIVGLAVAALVLLGFASRIEEYRRRAA